jgi:YHS domain-containing protein
MDFYSPQTTCLLDTNQVIKLWRAEMVIDPVCKMEIDEKTAAAKSMYKGKMYYFCSLGCKKAFDSNPEKYLSQK